MLAERKGLTPTSQHLAIIDFTVPSITRVTHRVTELFYSDFNELCITNIAIIRFKNFMNFKLAIDRLTGSQERTSSSLRLNN